jgi:DNA invertase Pin-like site-specific DNA recombinase
MELTDSERLIIKLKNSEIMREKVKTRQQIAQEYGIDRKTLYRWCKDHGIQWRGKRPLSIEEQEMVYTTFGDPYKYRKHTRRGL